MHANWEREWGMESSSHQLTVDFLNQFVHRTSEELVHLIEAALGGESGGGALEAEGGLMCFRFALSASRVFTAP